MDEALRMATLYPARLLNASATGMLEAGAKANIIVFDKDFKIRQVYLEGEAV
jgi:N-acetylglucosamine-6-phosphate deacetylase